MRILIVDDNKTNRLVLGAFCKHAGSYEQDYACDGAEAVNLYKANSYDVVFMDFMMPVMDGLEATSAIRSHAHANGLHPFIFIVTADTSKELMDAGYRAGADGYMAKPLTRETVTELVQRTHRDWLVTSATREHTQAMNLEALAAASIIHKLTRQDQVADAAWMWHVSKPSNGVLSGDLVCEGTTPSGLKRSFLADNMGHGLAASIISVVLHSLFTETLELPLSLAFTAMNNKLKAVLPTGVFTCGALFEVDTDNCVHILNASLPDLYIGDSTVKSNLLPMGVISLSYPPEPEILPLGSGAWLYTDGLSDALPDTVSLEWFSDSSGERESWHEFMGMLTALDDVTVLRVLPPKAPAV